MKKNFIKSLLLTSILFSLNSQAVTMLCGHSDMETGDIHYGLNNKHNFLVEEANETINTRGYSTKEISCKVLDVKKGKITGNQSVEMEIIGYGPGMRLTIAEGFMFNCPLVTSVEKLVRKPFYGVKASAGALIGASVGVFSNNRLGVCVLTSLSGLTIGAGISGTKIKFTEVSSENY